MHRAATSSRRAAAGARPARAGGETLGASFGALAQRLFKRRPVFLLLGCELKPGLERGDSSIGVSADVLRTHLSAMMLPDVAALLRIDHRAAGDRERSNAG